MGRPSIYSRNYYRVMRRRRIVRNLLIIAAVFILILYLGGKAILPDLKKIADSNVSQNSSTEGVKSQSGNKNSGASGSGSSASGSGSEITVNIPGSSAVVMTCVNNNGDIKLTGLKTDDGKTSYSIRDDGKAVVFDTPATSDIWVAGVDGSVKKISRDSYKSSNSGKEYKKASVMKTYNSDYVWASKPIFLQDGRIVYQSNLPWFKNPKDYYLWVVNSDGTGNRYIIGTGGTNPAKYDGFTESGQLIAEFEGNKYSIDVNSRRKTRID